MHTMLHHKEPLDNSFEQNCEDRINFELQKIMFLRVVKYQIREHGSELSNRNKLIDAVKISADLVFNSKLPCPLGNLFLDDDEDRE